MESEKRTNEKGVEEIRKEGKNETERKKEGNYKRGGKRKVR